jgi:vitamin B12 transporter
MRYLPSILCVALVAAGAHAQQPTDTSRLAPVVITASRTEAEQTVATTAATVLSGDALRARGISTVAAALREVPGASVVQTSAAGSQTSLFFRGGEADYVQVMIDGVTVNEPGGAFNFANLTLDNVERIEIIRGPASVLYGSDAVTGVIQIFTRQGTGTPRAELAARRGQRGMADAQGSLTAGGARGSYSVGAAHHASGGIYDLNNDARNGNASARVTFAPSSRSSLIATARYEDARYDYPTEYWGAPLDPDSYTTERRLTGGVQARHALHSRIDARLMLGVSRLANISDDRADPGSQETSFRYEARSLRRNADARVDLRLIPAATLTIGADFDWQETETAATSTEPQPPVERWSRGAYAQLLGNAMSRWTYTLGGRIEENERFGALSTIRGGLGVALTTSTTLRVSGGTAFKEPQFQEVTGGCCAIPNPGLGPERSESWELGIEQRLIGEALAVSATRFDQRFKDLIIFADDGAGQFQYRNARSATARGWELEARAALPGGPSLRGNLSTLDASMRASASEAETPLPRRPSRTASLVLAAPVGRMTFVGDASHVGPRHDTRFLLEEPFASREVLPSYTLVGAALTIRLGRLFGADDVELTARVDNLLDEEYEAVAGFATPGRIASVGARVRLGR